MNRRIPLAVTTGTLWPAATLESIHLLRENGVSDIELTLQSHEFRFNFKRKLQMPIFAQIKDLVETGRLNVRSLHGVRRMDAEEGYCERTRLEYLRHAVEVCHVLGGCLITAHPFHYFKTHEAAAQYLSGEVKEIDKALLDGFTDVLQQAEDSGIILTLENVCVWSDDEYDFFNNPASLQRFVEDLHHPNVGVTLDFAHAWLAGGILLFLEVLKDSIRHVHVTDILPPYRRVPPGEGRVDWDALVPRLWALPNLAHATLEMGDVQPEDIRKSAAFLSRSQSAASVPAR